MSDPCIINIDLIDDGESDVVSLIVDNVDDKPETIYLNPNIGEIDLRSDDLNIIVKTYISSQENNMASIGIDGGIYVENVSDLLQVYNQAKE